MPENNDPSPLLVLPTELQALIFANLEATDLAALRMVCTHFATFIHEAPELQYKIELAISGMVNGPPDGPPLTDRLQSLRDYREAWEAGDLPTQEIAPPHGSTWRGTAGVVVYFSSPWTLVIHRPASTFSGITEKTWTITPECLNSATGHFELEYIAVDVSQDLVVLTKKDGAKAEGHLLSLSRDGAPHPLAQNSVIDITLDAARNIMWGDDIEIVGDFVRWRFQQHGQAHNGLEVWNWKIGRIVWRHESDSEDDGPTLHLLRCHILDSSHILAIDRTSLFVYEIAHRDQEPLSSPTEGRALLRLRLPSTADGVGLRIVESRLQRSHSSTDGGHSFHGDPSLAVLALHISLYKSPDEPSADYEIPLVLVPLTTIHGLVRRFCPPPPSVGHGDPSPVDAAWDTWGPSGARMFLMHEGVHTISTMGSQCAIVYAGNPNTRGWTERGVFVVEVRARTQLDPADEEILNDMVDVDARECLEYPELFESPIHTTLPYCLSRTPGPIMPWGSLGSVHLLHDTVLHIEGPLAWET